MLKHYQLLSVLLTNIFKKQMLMNKKLNELLNEEILNKVPKNLKPIVYLVDKLKISKESAYRRMRGEIPFSFEELAVLSLNLEFSADEIIGNNKGNRIFFDLVSNRYDRPEDNFLSMFQEYCNFTELVCKATEREMMISINRLSLRLLLKYDSLFKFFYYKWIHQTSNVSISYSFSNANIPTEILNVRNKYKSLTKTLSNVSFIISKDIFLSIVREIQYYYGRKLISRQELLMLKQDLTRLLYDMESLMQKGYNEYGCKYNFYLSLLDVESNTTWSSFDSKVASYFWLYPVNSINIYDQKICDVHKKWLESLKKYSVLITQSNEILQTKFIEKQREHIENIANDLIYYE
jgi:hypothetical protein